MRPEILQELIKLELDVLNGNQLNFDMRLLDGKDQEKICLTLKNYKMAKGVSTQIHGVVPVLDAPEDEVFDMDLMKDKNTSRDLDFTVDHCSPQKGKDKANNE